MNTIIAVCTLLASLVTAQETKAPVSVAGVWLILMEGHQVGLGLEQEGAKLTGTLQIMGKNVPVDGDFIDSTLTLTGDAAVGAHGDRQTVPLKITATLKDDGTLEGEMNTARGPMKWTAERLKPPK
jgi:hypothetical protein